jgi:hypothetical protein
VTTPDYPDFVPASVPIAATQVLVPPTNTLNAGANQVAIDVSRFTAVNLTVVVIGTAAIQQLDIQVSWTTAGQVVAVDSYSAWNGGPQATFSAQATFQLPCKGDSVGVSFVSDSIQPTFRYSISATTRQLPGPLVSSTVHQTDLVPAYGNAVSLAAGGRLTQYLGPLTSGVNLSLGAGSTKVLARLSTMILDSGNWVSVEVADLASPATGFLNQDIHAPGVVLVLTIINTDTVAHACTWTALDLR